MHRKWSLILSRNECQHVEGGGCLVLGGKRRKISGRSALKKAQYLYSYASFFKKVCVRWSLTLFYEVVSFHSETLVSRQASR